MEGLMAELLKVFDFEGCPVRTVHGDDGEPWFVARDVAEVLYLDTAAVGRTMEPDERGLHAVQTPSGIQQMVVVNEAGLYAMVFKSRKPEARRFKRWVVHEVLPTIRKTGAYVTDAAAASDPILAQAQMLIEMRLKQIAQEQRLAAIEKRIDTLPAPTTHLSVLAFANLSGIRLDNRLASVLGKHCAALTRL
jgi:prophage antirepressor-like protein